MDTLRLLEELYRRPVITAAMVKERLEISYAGANSLISLLVNQGLLREITSRERNHLFAYAPYLELFTDEPVDREIAATLLD